MVGQTVSVVIAAAYLYVVFAREHQRRLSSVIHPILITTQSVYDLMVLIVFSAVVWFVARSQKEISRGEGMTILAMYIGYMVYIILR